MSLSVKTDPTTNAASSFQANQQFVSSSFPHTTRAIKVQGSSPGGWCTQLFLTDSPRHGPSARPRGRWERMLGVRTKEKAAKRCLAASYDREPQKGPMEPVEIITYYVSVKILGSSTAAAHEMSRKFLDIFKTRILTQLSRASANCDSA